MFDGVFDDSFVAQTRVRAPETRAGDPLELLVALERRLDRSDERMAGQLRALEGRLAVLERDVEGILRHSADGHRGVERKLVELADRLSGIEARRGV
jgi:hypothetical protein